MKPLALTQPNSISNVLKRNKPQKFRLTPKIIGYHFHYPATIFTENAINRLLDEQAIRKALYNRNPYYLVFSEEKKDLLVERVDSLKSVLEFINTKIIDILPQRDIVSIYACGSYIYANRNYIPEDIDIGVVVEGSTFQYFPKIPMPYSFSNKLGIPVKYLSLNFYGRENLERGIPVGQRMSSKDIEMRREAAVGYRRNVVIQGRDFMSNGNDLHNAYAAKVEMLIRCYLRLLGWGRYAKEADEERLQKLASRLYSLSVFLKFFNPKAPIDLKQASVLPVLAQQERFGYEEVKRWYNKIVKYYNALQNKMLPRCCSNYERNRS